MLVGPGRQAQFATLAAALQQAPAEGETILLEPGTYREKLKVDVANIHLIGLGRVPADVVITWDDSAGTAGGTGKSGTLTVAADGFEAENLTVENSFEREHGRTEQGSQAVALYLSSDRAVLDRVRLLGAQDTLYANSRTCRDTADATPCRASRELFNECYIEGHVDFIFGDAFAVFNHCELHTLSRPTVMLTAQSKHAPAELSEYVFLHCRVTGQAGGEQVYFGRPWRAYSTVLFYDTELDRPLNPAGWLEWDGRLRTSTYRDYKTHGLGVQGGQRSISEPPLSRAEEKKLTPMRLLTDPDAWNPMAAVQDLRTQLNHGRKQHRREDM